MLGYTILLTLVAVASCLPVEDALITDWPHHPGCHYNISQQANLHLQNVGKKTFRRFYIQNIFHFRSVNLPFFVLV